MYGEEKVFNNTVFKIYVHTNDILHANVTFVVQSLCEGKPQLFMFKNFLVVLSNI